MLVHFRAALDWHASRRDALRGTMPWWEKWQSMAPSQRQGG
jgi:hypothetical protein